MDRRKLGERRRVGTFGQRFTAVGGSDYDKHPQSTAALEAAPTQQNAATPSEATKWASTSGPKFLAIGGSDFTDYPQVGTASARQTLVAAAGFDDAQGISASEPLHQTLAVKSQDPAGSHSQYRISESASADPALEISAGDASDGIHFEIDAALHGRHANAAAVGVVTGHVVDAGEAAVLHQQVDAGQHGQHANVDMQSAMPGHEQIDTSAHGQHIAIQTAETGLYQDLLLNGQAFTLAQTEPSLGVEVHRIARRKMPGNDESLEPGPRPHPKQPGGSLRQNPPSVAGVYTDGYYFYFLEQDTRDVYGLGLSNDGMFRGLTYALVFRGKLDGELKTGTKLTGTWSTVPRTEPNANFGPRSGDFSLSLYIPDGPDSFYIRLLWVKNSPSFPSKGSLFRIGNDIVGGAWAQQTTPTYGQFLMPVEYKDADEITLATKKNSGETLHNGDHWYLSGENSNPWPVRDAGTFFGQIAQGEKGIHPKALEATYAAFKKVQEYDYDGDISFDLGIDVTQLNRSDNLWQGCLTIEKRDKFRLHIQNLDFNRAGPHCEIVMFARDNDDDSDTGTPTLPGWADGATDGHRANSVMVNGTPIAGVVAADRSNVVTKLAKYSIEEKTRLRVQGMFQLDPAHEKDVEKPEIHPVYAIDIVETDPMRDPFWIAKQKLDGAWTDDDGGTWYLQSTSTGEIFGLGLPPYRDWWFATVLYGVLVPRNLPGNGVADYEIEFTWSDVPFGRRRSHGRGVLRPTRDRFLGLSGHPTLLFLPGASPQMLSGPTNRHLRRLYWRW